MIDETAGNPVRQSEMIKDIVGSIARIPDPLKRSIYIKECAALVKVEEQLLINATNKKVSENIEKANQQRAREIRQRERQQRLQQSPPPGPTPQDSSFPSAPPVNFPEEVPDNFPGHPSNISEGSGAQPDLEGVVNRQNQSTKTGEFQERDIARILVTSGGQFFDKEKKVTVAQFILSNLEEVLDEFESYGYKKIVMDCLQRVAAQQPISQKHFISHSDPEIADIAINLLQPPFEMSPNWIDKWDLPLRSQPMPEENFNNDSMQAIRRFKLRKVNKVLAQNQERIKKAQEEWDDEKAMKFLKIQMKLIQTRNDLARDLGTVTLK